jgi:two-component sensor histidine kinase
MTKKAASVKVAFVVLSLIAGSAYSQGNCRCAVYEDLLKDRKPKSEIYNDVVKERSKVCQAKAVELLGVIEIFEKNNLDSAEFYLKTAEAMYKKIDCGDGVLWNTYKQRFQVYWSRSDFPNAQEYGFKFLHSAEAAENYYEQAIANTMIAIVFYRTGQFDKGIVFNDKAAELLAYVTNLKDKQNLLYFLFARYMSHYLNTESKSSIEKSLKYNLQHLALSKQLKDTTQFARSYFNLSGTEDENKSWIKSMAYLDSGYVYIDKTDSLDLFDYHVNKASLFLELKKYKDASVYADSSLSFVIKTGNKFGISESYRLISEIAQADGNYKKALDYSKLERNIKDSIHNVERTEAVAEIEKKYNQAKNEQTIQKLSFQKKIYLLATSVGLMAIVALIFFIRQQRLKNKKNILETEQRLNRARMNPHFFFNALSALQKFALAGAEGNEMASSLSRFSHIMRETLESTYKEYVTVEQEIQFLTEYLEVQKMRFPTAFTYQIKADPALDVSDVLIPSMILQPFLENVIEHGFVEIDYAGNIQVLFNERNKEILIEIQDNGKGLNTTPKENNEHISRASQIIKDRIYLLNIKLKSRAGFSINNVNEGTGVIVRINLPLLFK